MSTSHEISAGTDKRFHAIEIIRVFTKAVYYFGLILVMVIMFMITIDVIGRFFFNKPLWGVLEISEFLLAGAVLLGLAYTEFLDGHVRVELIYDRLSPNWQNRMRMFYNLVGLVFYSLITWESGRLAIEALTDNLTSDVLKIPAWPFRAFVPIGAFLTVLILIVKISNEYKMLRSRRTTGCH
jgi:TRAP-type C4-dicarboxylate transport system permease small subunit